MAFVHVKPKSQWKTVDISASLISGTNFNDLIELQELSDYELEEIDKGAYAEESTRKKKSKKKRQDQDLLEEDCDTKSEDHQLNASEDEEEEFQPELKLNVKGAENKKRQEKDRQKKKKRKKKQKKGNVLSVDSDITADNELSVMKTNHEESSGINKMKDMEAWDGLGVPDLVLAALQDQGFTAPTPIQTLTIPHAIRDRLDIIGAAETGSGKTLAFGIPVLNHIIKKLNLTGEKVTRDLQGPLALILEPTRELAIQVMKHLNAAAKHLQIKAVTVIGGMSVQKQARLLAHRPEIIIATPGRLWELIEEGQEHLQKLNAVEQLVVDEADRMVEKGHFEELSKILALVNSDEVKRKTRQTYIFSATLTMEQVQPNRQIKKRKVEKNALKHKLDQLVEQMGIKGKPKVVDLTRKEAVVHTLTEAKINCQADEKDLYLYYLLHQYGGRTLVFCNSKDCIRRLVSIFTLLNCNPLPLHADMHQSQRLKNLDRFTEKTKSLLLASDVAARGLDIPNVDHVIHYQVPRTVENYVHRSGRTARASKEGLSVILVSPEDISNFRKIVNHIKQGSDLPDFPMEIDTLHHLKSHVALACEIDKQEHRLMKQKRNKNWMQKAAEEMDIELDRDLLGDDEDEDRKENQLKQQLKRLKAQLQVILKQPVLPSKFSSRYLTKTGHLVLPVQNTSSSAVADLKTTVKKRKHQEI
ncbi:hypothetical protein C0Q70_16143 [Pomacea canaliculata]|uniref:ATP-dependent RNA helicase n=2 Tax=Pomacea canaliculata TaxID=400727 RepID=A0A2T7NNZ1_POMCA|nr:hypothetical protein C0Q70_16143 [Pomacea canaliculata]